MVVSYTGSKVFPCSVVVADVGQTTRLRGSSVDVKVCFSDVRSDAETSNGVATVSVDGLDVNSVVRTKTVRVEIP